MKPRNMLAILILIAASIASFTCYTRMNELLPMSNPEAVTKAAAKITAVEVPMVKKGQSTSDVLSDVRFTFEAAGNSITGGYLVRGMELAPKVGAKEPVVYLTKHPEIFLRAKDYDDLPRQLSALRWMMVGFALVAMVLPFAVMKHR
jgi:hypothetical protein